MDGHLYIYALTLIVGILAGVGVTRLQHDYEQRQRELTDRIAKLEEASDRRHLPYKTAESIENAEAVVIRRMQNRKAEFDFANAEDENLLGHLKNARNNR